MSIDDVREKQPTGVTTPGPSTPIARPDRRAMIGGAIVLGVVAIGSLLAYFGGFGDDTLLEMARAVETEARTHRGWYALVYFAVVFAALAVAVPFGNVLLALAAYLVGVPHALAAHMAALLLVTVLHYGLASLGLAAFMRRLAEDVIARGGTHVAGAVFTSARRDPISSAIILRLGLGTPPAVTNLVSALIGIPLLSLLAATALVSWMRPLLIAWVASSLADVQTFAQVAAALATAGAMAIPLLIIPAGLFWWVAKRNMPASKA